MTTLGNCWPQELPVNHTVCNKTNVEIQILYLECQWKPHKSIIFSDWIIIEILLILTQSVYGHLKWCAHIASTEQNEGPLPRTQGGTWNSQSVDGSLNSFAYVQQVSLILLFCGGKLSKLKLWTRIYIGINERRCTSWQNHLKMWSIYWVMSFKALDTAERLLKRYQWKTIACLTGVIPEWTQTKLCIRGGC